MKDVESVPFAVQQESLLMIFLFGLRRADHHLRDKVDNSAGGLLGVLFGKQVTHILCAAPAFPRNEAKDPVTHTHAYTTINKCTNTNT